MSDVSFFADIYLIFFGIKMSCLSTVMTQIFVEIIIKKINTSAFKTVFYIIEAPKGDTGNLRFYTIEKLKKHNLKDSLFFNWVG